MLILQRKNALYIVRHEREVSTGTSTEGSTGRLLCRRVDFVV